MIIDSSKCRRCNICTALCLNDAIDLQKCSIDSEKCNLCSHCISACPHSAISHNGRLPRFVCDAFSEQDFSSLVKRRRTHRHFLKREINETTIHKICDLLRFCPTGTNSQKVFITVIATRARLRCLTDIVISFFRASSSFLLSPLVYPFVRIALGKKARKLKRYSRYLDMYPEKDILAWDAPALFIFHAPKNSSTPDQDCSIWSSVGVHYAETLGLGTCFNGFFVYGLNLSKRARRYAQIPKGHKVYSTFLAGYPKYKYLREALREDVKLNILK